MKGGFWSYKVAEELPGKVLFPNNIKDTAEKEVPFFSFSFLPASDVLT